MSGTKRISALTAHASTDLADEDLLVVVDMSQSSVTDKTKKITAGSLLASANTDAKVSFKTVALLLADTTVLGYSGARFNVSAGDIITAGGYRYEVVGSGTSSGSVYQTNYQVTTSGGVRLTIPSNQIITPFHWGAVEEPEGTFDGADQATKLQSFFDYLANNKCVADATGAFRFDTPLQLTHATEVACRLITGDMFLRAGVQFDEYGIYLHNNHPDAYWFDNLHVQLLGGSAISLRQTPIAIKYGQTGRLAGGTYTAENAQIWGHYEDTLNASSNSNLMRIAKFRALKCGSGHDATGGTQEAAAYGITHYGTASSTSQATRITPYAAAGMPPTGLDYCGEFSENDPATESYAENDENAVWIEIQGRIHRVIHIDRTGTAFWVYPQLDHSIPHATGTGTAFRWVYGGARMARSGDSNVSDAIVLEAVNCGQGLADVQLYGTSVNKLLCDDVGIAMVFGSGGYHVGSHISSAYLESCRFHILTGTQDCTFHVGESSGIDLSKIVTTVNPSDASGLATWGTPALQKGSIVLNGATYRGIKGPRQTVSATISYDLASARPAEVYKADTVTVALAAATGSNDATGIDGSLITVVGTGTNRAPTTITFDPPSGHAINGGSADATAAFSGFAAPAQFVVSYDGSTDWTITPLRAMYRQSAVSDPGTATVDTDVEARAAIAAIIDALQAAGLMET